MAEKRPTHPQPTFELQTEPLPLAGRSLRIFRSVLHWVGLGSSLLLACQTGVRYEHPGEDPGASPDSGAGVVPPPPPQDAATPDPTPNPCPAPQRCGREQRLCCADGEECVDGVACLPLCEHTRCGSSAEVCCGAEQVCIDDVVCGAACAADEILCGAGLDRCCAAGQVCLADTCVTPGAACGDDFDCQDDRLYCEAEIGRCLPTREEVMCEGEPHFNAIALKQEWHFPGATFHELLYENVIAAPMVGDVSGDDIPDVVVPFYAGADLEQSVLVALSGDSGALLFVVGDDDSPIAQSSVALANFDADPALEIVYLLRRGGARILKGDGVTEVAARSSGGGFVGIGAPAIADLDADGTPDVVVGCHAMNGLNIGDPSLDFFDHGDCLFESTNVARSLPLIADLDGDGQPEITTGGVAYNLDGSAQWEVSGDHALTAIADLDVDGEPEVIAVRSGQVWVREGATGRALLGPGGSWADQVFEIPGGDPAEDGGPPTVADFDADGLPEIATAGQAHYVVYDPDCLAQPPREGGDCPAQADAPPFLRWSTNTQDISSSRTGSSVFDFQGDGAAEVIYNDECFLHIYNGSDGSEALAEVVPNSSRTDLEYPLVVDVDRDGNSEIVVPANRDQALSRDHCDDAYAAALAVPKAELPATFAQGTAGIFVFGDPADRWVRTRPIWNQYSYHVTNVSEAGVVPAVEQDNFRVKGLNNYRQNVQGTTVLNAPNLTVELIAATRCLEREVVLSAEVSNTGTRGVPPGVAVTFVRMDSLQTEAVKTLHTTRALLPGGSERLTVVVADIAESEPLEFAVHVDEDAQGDEQVTECDERDNDDSESAFCEALGLF